MTPAVVAAEDTRYERKYVDDQLGLAMVEAMIRGHPCLFHRAYPTRFVNNIYVDTPGLDLFRDHVNGTRQRYKLRFRWYGPLVGCVPHPVLEVKIRTGHVGTKRRFEIDPFEFSECFDYEAVRRGFQEAGEAPDVSTRLAACRPSLVNRYTRQYFRSADGRYRVTLDHELCFHRVGALGQSFLQRVRDRRSTVVELKYAQGDDETVDAVSNLLPFRVAKHSKYVRGVAMIYGFPE